MSCLMPLVSYGIVCLCVFRRVKDHHHSLHLSLSLYIPLSLYLSIYLYLSLSIYIYVYAYMYIHLSLSTYIYIYIYIRITIICCITRRFRRTHALRPGHQTSGLSDIYTYIYIYVYIYIYTYTWWLPLKALRIKANWLEELRRRKTLSRCAPLRVLLCRTLNNVSATRFLAMCRVDYPKYCCNPWRTTTSEVSS